MKKIFNIFNIFIITLSITVISSCKKYLDVNQNVNTATTATPELVLPQAITAVAGQNWAYNFYGSQVAGYVANGGGVSGWGAIISYNYVSTDQQGLWNNSYNIAEDIQYVIDNSEGVANYVQLNAAAKVMKAFVFQRLVDQYNDIPYSESLKGVNNLTPKYDSATDIYKSLADLCDAAITAFKANPTANTVFRTSDVLFNGSSAAGQVTRWIQFAQTIKLRLIIRAGSKVNFSNRTFDTSIGFLTDDAIVQPGYSKVDGKQNPTWNSFAYTFANAVVAGSTQYVPTPYILSWYNGTKLTDPVRANLYYKLGTSIPTNQLGSLLATAGRGQTPNSWFKGTSATAYDQAGIFKGFDAGQPIFLGADSYFLQAEGALKGIVAGDAKSLFDRGIVASYNYLDKNAAGAVAGTQPGTTIARSPSTEATAYQAANASSYLANYNLANTDEQRLEAIITQKYLALNMLFGDEAWNEYRRTGYPRTNTAISAGPTETFISIVSESTAPDRLPTRLQYPQTEYQYNAANIPTINKYSTKIFWAR